MPYAEYFHDLVKDARKHGLTVVFVPKKTLLDYEAMNPEAAKVLGFEAPPKQIEILKGLPIETQYADLHHELIERYLMKHGWKYFPAHKFSLEHENDLPGELKILKVHDDGDLTIEHKGIRYVVTTEGQTFKESKKMPREKLTTTDKLMNEVILYGGLPLRRADVYRDALEQTGSKKAADMFAFGERTQITTQKPLSLEQFQKITGGVKVKTMPAKSEKQRKLFGTALAMKRGEQPITPTPAGKIAETLPEKKIKEYAEKPEKLRTIRTYRENSKFSRGLHARMPKPRFSGMKSHKVGMVYATPVGGRMVLSRKPLKSRRR